MPLAEAIRPSGFPNLDLVSSQRDLVGIEVEFVGESGWEGRLKGILATVADRSTYASPAVAAIGFKHVLVNGTPVVRDGVLLDATPGRAIVRDR